MPTIHLTDDDIGKRVVLRAGGDSLGVVQDVEDGTAYIDPDPDLFDKIQVELNWGDSGGDTYLLDESDVATATNDEIRLR